MLIKFDGSRKIKIWFANDDNSPRVAVPIVVTGNDAFNNSYICFKWIYSGDKRKLYMEDRFYNFDGNLYVGKIDEKDQIDAYNDILTAHIDIWMYLDLATRIMEANHEHPIEITVGG